MNEDVTRWRAYRASASRRHSDRFLAYAESYAEPIPEHYDALESEQANLRFAIDYAYRDQQWEQIRRITWLLTIDGLHGFLPVRGYWTDLRACLERAIVA